MFLLEKAQAIDQNGSLHLPFDDRVTGSSGGSSFRPASCAGPQLSDCLVGDHTMSIDACIPFPGLSPSPERPGTRLRAKGGTLFSLVELDPREVVKGVTVAGGFAAEDVIPVGLMRERCPYCTDAPLELVLRANNVIRSHLFCEQCTRCFDAVYPDGSSALLSSRLPVVY
jgi:hypothetical protein